MRQLDWTAGSETHYAEAIENKLGKQTIFSCPDVAAVFDVSTATVREWIEEGRLPAADLNAGRIARDESGRVPEVPRPLRPFYRIERHALVDLAKRMEQGV